MKRYLLAALALAVMFIPVMGAQAWAVSPYLVAQVVDSNGKYFTVVATADDIWWWWVGPNQWGVDATAYFPNGETAYSYVYIDFSSNYVEVYVEFPNGTWYLYWNSWTDGFQYHAMPSLGMHFFADSGVGWSSQGFIPSASISVFFLE